MSRAARSGIAALFRDFRSYAGAKLWLALALMLGGALAEGFGLLMIVPLASAAIGEDGGRLAELGRWGAGFTVEQRFLAALALFVAAMAARSALLYARDVQLAALQSGYEASLRLRSAATLARRGWTFASRIGQSALQSLLLNDVPRVSSAISGLQRFAVAAAMLSVHLAIAAILSPELTLVALAIILAGSLLSFRWLGRGRLSGLALVESSEQSTGSGFRLHAGLKAALAQGTVPQFLAEYGSNLASLKREEVRFARDLAAARSMAFMGSAIAAALLFFIGARVLDLPFAVLIASLVLFARMAGPAQLLQQTAQNVSAYAPSFGAIERRLGRLEGPPSDERAARPLDWQRLELDDVAYEHQPGLGVRGMALELGRGQWIGISGPSGSGKTTLVDLAAGLLEPQSGAVKVDGEPLAGDLLERWRASLAYVGQDGSVFDDSVRGNLLAEGVRADDERLWSALAAVGLEDRVQAFDRGLDERVGDRGSQLSGGERQRLAIARALLRKPSLLILDEATAALDAKSEAELLDHLRGLDGRPAAILVAHRDSTLTHCDSVLSSQHEAHAQRAGSAVGRDQSPSGGVNPPDGSSDHEESCGHEPR
jgi:ATP-binding cassette subfamily C protein